MKILVVDDEPLVARLLRSFLSNAGYDVFMADSGPAAMKVSETTAFDVMISDVVMPPMNGHELARWMAENHPATKVILMSGFDPGCQKCPYSPRCAFLSKPFKMQDALALIEAAQPGSLGEGSRNT
jgi:two-component system cell cycle response regulator CpdR